MNAMVTPSSATARRRRIWARRRARARRRCWPTRPDGSATIGWSGHRFTMMASSEHAFEVQGGDQHGDGPGRECDSRPRAVASRIARCEVVSVDGRSVVMVRRGG